jgi:acyl-coenzyme A synthetase/AMP-(fatty) acid ligase
MENAHSDPGTKDAGLTHARGANAGPAKPWFIKQTIGSLLDERARRDSTREALLFEGRRATFAELTRDVDVLARGLIHLGIEPGEKVSLWMMNRPEWVHAALAVMRIGAVLVPINTRFPQRGCRLRARPIRFHHAHHRGALGADRLSQHGAHDAALPRIRPRGC